jgi:MFS family permease
MSPHNGTIDLEQRSPATADSPARPAAAFAVLAGVQFTLILAIGVLSLALPAIQHGLGLTRSQLAFAAVGYGLTFSGLLLLGGRLADRFGRRTTFLAGTAVFAAASAVAAVAPGFAVLLVARLLQGAGAAVAGPAAMSLLGPVFPDPVRRRRAIAAWGGISSAGATVGTLLGGLLAVSSWRWAFAVPAVATASALPAARRLVPHQPPTAGARVDVPGAVLATGGLFAVTYGLTETLTRPWSTPGVLAALVAGTVLLSGFVAVQARGRTPLLPPAFLASPYRVTGLVGVFLGATGAGSIGFLLSLYLQQVRGWSSAAASAAFLPYFLTLAASLAAGRLLVRVGVRSITVTGLVGSAAGLLLLGRLHVDTSYAGSLLAGLVLFTIGAGLTFAGATTAAVADAPDDEAGLAAGVMNTAMELGPTVGLALLVSLAGARTARLAASGTGPAAAVTGGYALALTVAGLAFAAAAVAGVRTLRPAARPKDRRET